MRCTLEDHTMSPKLLLATCKHVICTTESGGTVGSVIVGNYVHDGKAKVAKEIVEVVEPEKRLVMFRVVEGDIMEEFKSFLITIQVTPKQGGPESVVKLHFDYEKIDENVVHPETLLPFFVEMFKEIDDHLLSEE